MQTIDDIILEPGDHKALTFVAASAEQPVAVVSPELARRLDAIEKAVPELLILHPRQHTERGPIVPFFRAEITEAGRNWLSKVAKLRKPRVVATHIIVTKAGRPCVIDRLLHERGVLLPAVAGEEPTKFLREDHPPHDQLRRARR